MELGLKSKKELNGCRGRVVKHLGRTERLGVKLDDGRGPFNLSSENLRQAPPESDNTRVIKLSFSPPPPPPPPPPLSPPLDREKLDRRASAVTARTAEAAVATATSEGNPAAMKCGEVVGKAGIGPGLVRRCAACCRDATKSCKKCNAVVYCGRQCQITHWPFHKRFCAKGERDPSPTFSILTRRGLVGLCNLGNSCYMNSALACLSHVYPITRHFISGDFKEEINTENDLGSKGDIAKNLAALLQQLWFGSHEYVHARDLKKSVDRRTDQFRGYVQHDAGEYLSFVLDMIHEDLNRMKKQDYFEIPDPGDREDDVVGEELWELHRRRNDSIITHTVSGVYKSTIRCPQCKIPSRKFDPFNTIELPMPLHTSRCLRITVVRWAGSLAGNSQEPTEYAVEIWKTTKMGSVRGAVSRMCGIPEERLFIWETYQGKVFQILPDKFPAFRLATSDVIIASEIPPPSFRRQDDTEVLPSEQASNASNFDDANPGDQVVSLFVMHRSADGNGSAQRGRAAMGQARSRPPVFFDVPLFVAAKVRWTLRDLKKCIFAHISWWLPSIEPTDLDGILAHLKIAKVSADGAALQCPAAKGPVLASHYKLTDENLRLSDLLSTSSADRLTYLALEWNEHVLSRVVEGAWEKRVQHSSIQQLSHLEKDITLEQCFELFCKEEQLPQGEEYYCGKCKVHVEEAIKSMRLWRAPSVLIITLKRFGHQQRGGYGFLPDKLQDYVDFPLDGFDISRFMLDPEAAKLGSTSYDCFAVVNHYGHANFGHYKAAVRTDAHGMGSWYEFDDDCVRPIASEESVVSQVRSSCRCALESSALKSDRWA